MTGAARRGALEPTGVIIVQSGLDILRNGNASTSRDALRRGAARFCLRCCFNAARLRGPSERVSRSAVLKPIAVYAHSRGPVTRFASHRNFAVPGEAEASGHTLTLPEDAVRGPHHRGPRPRGLPRHQ